MSNNMWGSGETEYFYKLSIDNVLDAIDKLGPKTSGRCLQLNSMENRVYEVELSEVFKHNGQEYTHLVTKFYRPGRWSKEQIQEEHEFTIDLMENEIPVVAPLKFDGETLFKDRASGLLYCIFPKKHGRAIGELTDSQLRQIGRLLGRIHSIGAMKQTQHRLTLNPETYGENNLKTLLEANLIPENLKLYFEEVGKEIFTKSSELFKGVNLQRIHGDCHLGNLIYREDEGLFFVDFDDMVKGPCAQDLWLLIPANGEEAIQKRNLLLDGYEMFKEFDYREVQLIECLRALRYIHYAAWISKRYDDPSFQMAFPFFKEISYWQTLLQDLREQQFKIQGLSRQEYY